MDTRGRVLRSPRKGRAERLKAIRERSLRLQREKERLRRERAAVAREVAKVDAVLARERKELATKRALEAKLLAEEEKIAVADIALQRAAVRLTARRAWGIGPFPESQPLRSIVASQNSHVAAAAHTRRRLTHLASTLFQDSLHW